MIAFEEVGLFSDKPLSTDALKLALSNNFEFGFTRQSLRAVVSVEVEGVDYIKTIEGLNGGIELRQYCWEHFISETFFHESYNFIICVAFPTGAVLSTSRCRTKVYVALIS
jgi:hypothetical protein